MNQHRKEELRKEFDDFRIKSGGIYTTQNSASILIDFEWFYKKIQEREETIISLVSLVEESGKVIDSKNTDIQNLQALLDQL